MANSKDVVVTGASTGIGWGTTNVLVSKGFRVLGSVRKQADADRLQREFGNDLSRFPQLCFSAQLNSEKLRAYLWLCERGEIKHITAVRRNFRGERANTVDSF